MLTKRVGLALLLGLSGSGFAQQGVPQDSPYSDIVREAKQVIVYSPTLSDGNLVNALKMGNNLSVPLRVITTRNGLMQRNGFILTLIVLDIPTYEVPASGDKRYFMEVESVQGWKVYDISQGRPIEKRMIDYLAFNEWLGKNATKLRAYNPELATALWAKAFLGYDLNVSIDVRVKEKEVRPPTFLNPPTKVTPAQK